MSEYYVEKGRVMKMGFAVSAERIADELNRLTEENDKLQKEAENQVSFGYGGYYKSY